MAILRKNGLSTPELWVWGANVCPGGGQTANPTRLLFDAFGCAAGGYHCIAVMKDTTLMSWGRNQYGQVGDGSISKKLAPVPVLAVSKVREVVAGLDFSFALLEGGDLYGWGHNRSGCLGDGTTVQRIKPVKILSSVRSMAAGQDFAMAVLETGELLGWGCNRSGVLGDRFAVTGTQMQLTPAKILDNVAQAAAGGRHSMVLMKSGHCLILGTNTHGQFGNSISSTTQKGAHELYDLYEMSATLARDKGPAIKEDIAVPANDEQSRGILRTEAEYRNEDGMLLHSAQVFHTKYNKDGSIRLLVDRPLEQKPPVQSLAPPENENDEWRGSGDFAVYQSNKGRETDTTDILWPQKCFDYVDDVVAGGGHSFLILKGNACASMGWNSNGQLGDGSTNDRCNPISYLDQIRTVAAGYQHSLAVNFDADCFAWGCNHQGQLGVADSMPEGLTPMRIFSRVETVAAGLDHSLVLLQSGICFSWGCNTYGQLGNGTLVSSHVPSKVFLDGVYVGAGRSRSHVVNRLGTCFSWGRNSGHLPESYQVCAPY